MYRPVEVVPASLVKLSSHNNTIDFVKLLYTSFNKFPTIWIGAVSVPLKILLLQTW